MSSGADFSLFYDQKITYNFEKKKRKKWGELSSRASTESTACEAPPHKEKKKAGAEVAYLEEGRGMAETLGRAARRRGPAGARRWRASNGPPPPVVR